ncbi:MAG: hypothetical protein QOD56_1715 [Gammaproteobacteria bacterium]|jgi:hypothetical protein|nr:hypothetical protein [Gammaproteobacteria bacterium]
MSEVDRLSNSGLYPALPIAGQRRDKDGKPPPDPRGGGADSNSADSSPPHAPRPPKSLIDEYA